MNARPEPGPVLASWLGNWALARLVTRDGARRRPFRSALWSGALIALFSAPLIAVVARTSAADATDILALRVLAYASWLVGALGSSAFFQPEAKASSAGFLARERGFSDEELRRSWGLGVALRLAAAIFLITLLPLGISIALSPTPGSLVSRLMLLPGVAVYALLLGGALTALGRVSQHLTPRFPRVTLASLVLLPYFASYWFPGTPSVPGIFGWLLDGLIALGGWSP